MAHAVALALNTPVWLADRARWVWREALGPLAKPHILSDARYLWVQPGGAPA